jgi:ABC-type branched-subunit amino acid transport system substrate-binding protein
MNMRKYRQWLTAAATLGIAAIVAANPAAAQKKYGPGASDIEIKIGNIMPYSGPNSVFGEIAKTEGAYFRKINAEGGINGRKINSSAMTMPTAHQRRWSRPESWSKATKFCSSSTH